VFNGSNRYSGRQRERFLRERERERERDWTASLGEVQWRIPKEGVDIALMEALTLRVKEHRDSACGVRRESARRFLQVRRRGREAGVGGQCVTVRPLHCFS